MSIGLLVRKILGPKFFKPIGKIYRRFFVNLDLVAQNFPDILNGKHLLDVGGGDGELINHLVQRFPTIKITMIDIAGKIGNFVDQKYKNNIKILPNTSILEYKNKYLNYQPIDYILISDVLHHIKPADRKQFFDDLAQLINTNTVIIIKDIEHGYLKARLSYLADKYISGDKTVELISRKEVEEYMKGIFPQINFYETDLLKQNNPNYCLVFKF